MSEEAWTIVSNTVNRFDDEENDDLKENWDDEDEEEELSKASSTGETSAPKETIPKEPAATGKKKKKALLKEKIAQKEERSRPLTAEELLAEKLERQRLVEESDLAMALDTFGVKGKSDTSVLGTIRLATNEDFEDFGKALEEKLNPYARSPHFVMFFENLVRNLAVSLDSDDIKKINTALTALYNEKIKLQKQSKGKKAKKQAEIRMERDHDFSYDQYNDTNDFDDFL